MRWPGILQGSRSYLPYLSRRVDREGIHQQIYSSVYIGARTRCDNYQQVSEVCKLTHMFDGLAPIPKVAPKHK